MARCDAARLQQITEYRFLAAEHFAHHIGRQADFPAGLALALCNLAVEQAELHAVGLGQLQLAAPGLREEIAALMSFPQGLYALLRRHRALLFGRVAGGCSRADASRLLLAGRIKIARERAIVWFRAPRRRR